MKIYHTVPQVYVDQCFDENEDILPCTKCEKDIDLEDGFYHCSIDYENYHQVCPNNNEKK